MLFVFVVSHTLVHPFPLSDTVHLLLHERRFVRWSDKKGSLKFLIWYPVSSSSDAAASPCRSPPPPCLRPLKSVPS